MTFTKRLKVVCSEIGIGLVNQFEEYYVEELIDKQYFRVFISQDIFTDVPKYYFNYIIDQYVVYNKCYGEMQLPIIQENIFDCLVSDPYGNFIKVSKKDCQVKQYKFTQYLDCSRINYL